MDAKKKRAADFSMVYRKATTETAEALVAYVRGRLSWLNLLSWNLDGDRLALVLATEDGCLPSGLGYVDMEAEHYLNMTVDFNDAASGWRW